MICDSFSLTEVMQLEGIYWNTVEEGLLNVKQTFS